MIFEWLVSLPWWVRFGIPFVFLGLAAFAYFDTGRLYPVPLALGIGFLLGAIALTGDDDSF